MTTTTMTAGDQTTLSYTDHGGDGPTVLLVHGITESSVSWDPVVALLADSHRIVTMDLRGHGRSGKADRYDLEAMAGDVITIIGALGVEASEVHLIGHSLGGAVVSAAGGAVSVASIVNVDQSLQLGEFKANLTEVEPMLRDPDSFPAVIEGLFAGMAGEKIDAEEMARVNAARNADQEVVLGVWELMFTMSADEIAAVVEGALNGYAGSDVDYLSLFGIDPGPDYGAWLSSHISNAQVELWPEHGHYPHLADTDRFVARLREFWS